MTYKTTILADSPTSLWMLDEAGGAGSAADSSSGGVTLTATSVTFGSTGLATNIGSSASFNGTTSKLVGGAFAAQTNPAAAFGYEAWVKSSSATVQVIASGRTTGGGSGPTLYIDSTGVLSFYDGQIDLSNAYFGTKTINDNAAHYVAFIWDGTHLSFYVDGALDVQRNKISTGTSAGVGVYGVGWDNNSVHQFFNGNIAAVGYYVGANQLTATMLANHYTAGTGIAALPRPNLPRSTAVMRAATR